MVVKFSDPSPKLTTVTLRMTHQEKETLGRLGGGFVSKGFRVVMNGIKKEVTKFLATKERKDKQLKNKIKAVPKIKSKSKVKTNKRIRNER